MYDREIDRGPGTAAEKRYLKLTLAMGRHVNRARLAWCREAREIVRAAGRRRTGRRAAR